MRHLLQTITKIPELVPDTYLQDFNKMFQEFQGLADKETHSLEEIKMLSSLALCLTCTAAKPVDKVKNLAKESRIRNNLLSLTSQSRNGLHALETIKVMVGTFI